MPLILSHSLLSPSVRRQSVPIPLGEGCSVTLTLGEVDRGRLSEMLGAYSAALESVRVASTDADRAARLGDVRAAEDAICAAICLGWDAGEILTHDLRALPPPVDGKERADLLRRIGIFDPVFRACIVYSRGERPTTAGE